MLLSSPCKYEDFLSDWYTKWALRLNLHVHNQSKPASQDLHRKTWEWCAIAQALEERGMLANGRSGCGFAVGREPLPSAFASAGVNILATDQELKSAKTGWTESNQHASSLECLYNEKIINWQDFNARVQFKAVNMRKLQLPWHESFDFIWSSCSIEHLGTLEAGFNFILESMRLLKPGGIAVHTTEFNVSSNTSTIESGGNVIYRRRDIEALDRRLRKRGCCLVKCDFFAGDASQDLDFDYPPYSKNGRPHIKLLLCGHIATSFILIIRKGNSMDINDLLLKQKKNAMVSHIKNLRLLQATKRFLKY